MVGVYAASYNALVGLYIVLVIRGLLYIAVIIYLHAVIRLHNNSGTFSS